MILATAIPLIQLILTNVVTTVGTEGALRWKSLRVLSSTFYNTLLN